MHTAARSYLFNGINCRRLKSNRNVEVKASNVACFFLDSLHFDCCFHYFTSCAVHKVKTCTLLFSRNLLFYFNFIYLFILLHYCFYIDIIRYSAHFTHYSSTSLRFVVIVVIVAAVGCLPACWQNWTSSWLCCGHYLRFTVLWFVGICTKKVHW